MKCSQCGDSDVECDRCAPADLDPEPEEPSDGCYCSGRGHVTGCQRAYDHATDEAYDRWQDGDFEQEDA